MMLKAAHFLRSSGLQILAVFIALVLWAQVHGQGTGSISMDVPLQVEGLHPDIAIVNNLPDHVRVTVSGLQARLSGLTAADIRVPLDVSRMDKPGVVDQALETSAIRTPADAARMADAGAHALLIGEALVTGDDVESRAHAFMLGDTGSEAGEVGA